MLALVLALTGAQQLLAQDAFYIYRNDGDFNGFFFDEIVRMGYSKTDLEGEEHDVYVVQEIETKDSLYRIPLAAIDSIGFQQPEIRINPRVRIIEQCELKDYYTDGYVMGEEVYVFFDNLPDASKPKVGDVLIKTVSSMDDFYSGRGYSCVVDRVEFFEPNTVMAVGHFVTDPGEVFDQFISVEDVTIDEQGKARRRLAGWHPEKGVRHDPKKIGITPIDFDINLTQEWNPAENIKVAIDAKLGLKVSLRATYDIGWSKLYVKLNQEVTTKTQASATLGLKADFWKELDDIVQLPELIFPAACPIFGVNPYPSLFFHAWGEISASVKLSEAELTIGNEIIFNTDWAFPVDFSIYVDTPERKDEDKVISVEDTSIKFAGSMQAGIKACIDVGTANWVQKIIKGNVGFYAYIGPQIDAQLELQTKWFDSPNVNLYTVLRQAEVDVSLLSVNLEAKATARALWGEEQEKTFLTKDWKFLCDTLLFVPRFKVPGMWTTYGLEDPKKVTLAINTEPKSLFNLNRLSIGIYEPPADKSEYDYNDEDMILVRRVGDWPYTHYASAKYEYTLTEEDIKSLKGTKPYAVVPMVTWLGHGPYPTFGYAWGDFICPCTMDMEKQELRFGGHGGEESLKFSTNCLKEQIEYEGAGDYGDGWWLKKATTEVLNEEEGRYRAIFKATSNTTFWDRKLPAAIVFKQRDGSVLPGDRYPIDVSQAANDLSNFEIEAGVSTSGKYNDDQMDYFDVIFPRCQVTGTRVGNDLIQVKGKDSRYSIQFNIQRVYTTNSVTGDVIAETKITDGFIRNDGDNNSYVSASFHGVASGHSLILYIDSSTHKDEDGRTFKGNSGNINMKAYIDGQNAEF